MQKSLLWLKMTLCFFPLGSLAQKNDIQFEKTKKVQAYLNWKHSSLLQTYPGSGGESEVFLKTIPDKIEIFFLDENYITTSITFSNSDSESITYTANKAEKDAELLQLADFNNGKLTFQVENNQVYISRDKDKASSKRFPLIEGKTKISFGSTKKTAPSTETSSSDESEEYCTKKSDTISQKILSVKLNLVDSAVKCILCNCLPICDKDTAKHKSDSIVSHQKNEDRKKHPQYICLYDVSGPVTWYQDSVSKQNKIDIKDIQPQSRSEITIFIKGNDTDEDYIVTADGQSFFFDDAGKAAQLVSGGNEQKADTVNKNKTETKNSTPPVTPTTDKSKIAKTALKNVKATNTGKLSKTSLTQVTVNPKKYDELLIPKTAKLKKQQIQTLQTDYQNEFTTLYNRNIFVADSMTKSYEDSLALSRKSIPMYTVEWKTKFLALDKILEDLNARYANNDFLPAELAQEIAKIQQGIKNCLQIPVGNDPQKLRDALHIIRCSEVDPAYLDDCDMLIESIVTEYKTALSKTTHRRMFTKTIEVPDEDEFTLGIKAKKTEKSILERTFIVKGGFKIDFSSGFFFTGLANPDYTLARSNFKYYESKDSVVVTGGVPRDTSIYTGNVKDISGNFIRENKAKLTYGAGLFAHGYWRSGNFFNWGGAVGLVLNNTGQLLGMLGGSAMFRAGKNRISLVSGIAIGKRQFISSTASQYQYKNDYVRFENGQGIYQNLRNVPRFYENGAENKVETYEKWTGGYFFGITFNFATISPGSKKNP